MASLTLELLRLFPGVDEANQCAAFPLRVIRDDPNERIRQHEADLFAPGPASLALTPVIPSP